MRQRARQPQLQPLLVGGDADGLVPPRLVGLAVGGQKQPLGLPALPPLHPGYLGRAPILAAPAVGGVGNRLAQLGEPGPTTAHRHSTCAHPPPPHPAPPPPHSPCPSLVRGGGSFFITPPPFGCGTPVLGCGHDPAPAP